MSSTLSTSPSSFESMSVTPRSPVKLDTSRNVFDGFSKLPTVKANKPSALKLPLIASASSTRPKDDDTSDSTTRRKPWNDVFAGPEISTMSKVGSGPGGFGRNSLIRGDITLSESLPEGGEGDRVGKDVGPSGIIVNVGSSVGILECSKNVGSSEGLPAAPVPFAADGIAEGVDPFVGLPGCVGAPVGSKAGPWVPFPGDELCVPTSLAIWS
eukprot:scaffold4396_cov196-Pinguiococcus_pyrenoidosus.AAC.1